MLGQFSCMFHRVWATLGGIALFGLSGIVIGPLVAGLFLASWSILGEQRATNG